MITFTKLLERAKTEKIAVHTVMEEQAEALLKALDERGYVWASGVKLTTKEYYENCEERTCYNFGFDKQVWYDSRSYCQEAGYTIIEFKDIEFKERKSNMITFTELQAVQNALPYKDYFVGTMSLRGESRFVVFIFDKNMKEITSFITSGNYMEEVKEWVNWYERKE